MADTMQLVTAASTDVPRRVQTCKSGRVTRRQSAMKLVASSAFARLAKGSALALAVVAGIAVATRSAVADEMWKASRQTSAAAAPSSPGVAGRQRILAHPTDPDPTTRYVEKLYKQLKTADALDSSVVLGAAFRIRPAAVSLLQTLRI